MVLFEYSTGASLMNFIQKMSCSLKLVVPEFQKYKKEMTFNFSKIFEK